MRGALRVAAMTAAGELASRTIEAALDPNLPPDRAVRAVLDLVEAVEPRAELTVQASLPTTAEEVEQMSLEQLMQIAQSHSIQVPELDPGAAPPE